MKTTVFSVLAILVWQSKGQVEDQHFSCPNGWVAHGFDCYKAFNLRVNHADALCECAYNDAQLVMPQNSVEQAFFGQLAANSTTGEGLWLAGDDKEKEGTFVNFFSSQPLSTSFVNWIPGEPNGMPDEDCAAMVRNKGWEWNDADCRVTLAFICRRIGTHPT